ncbi:phosphatidylinositol mannoside acyltransferase [Corynebacterium sp. 320]|uniref:Phosphatidylinositol mannoside acyltransferase n=1 Tax=Corynebacterium zhongnanshanii TaxID=2768834 RepID=A0ABQ6VG84_9CORY|nr:MULTISPECIES: phosphatidylinositol mannoside acyltransferase [Corynebacterium]KAB1503730.1 phosphatidylinositol mannoside acyltransferase [Corynebacterium sp. 320]KAB1553170.1 phosphatidylinositol mannoside acyltransferase [Corynebacterium sp. 321]KAB1553612.1 phosphatidylinositol mannoside acyltransferase [Corynebacterium sp. 319]KAB3523420.1 phosphatidylinositol mannoside acyltransferase [Corynebacterium zhongnanshanii]KAB3527866.1 phosphatidylinositol mannoside acyltransferase [Corynebac
MADLRQRISAWGYIAGWKVTAALPDRLARAMFNGIADLASKKGTQPEQLRKNLARVVGEDNVTTDLMRRSMRSYMRYWREAFRLPTMAGHDLANRVNEGFVDSGNETVLEAIKAGQGLVLVLPHMGNWDMAGMWLVDRAGPFSTVAERLKPESLFDAFVEYRESLGFEIIAHEGTQESPFHMLEKRLNQGGIVCLMGDRDLSGHGVPVRFFGETAFMPRGAALLAQRTGARLIVAGLGFDETADGHERWVQRVREITNLDRPVEEIVQEQASIFEEFISAHPADWHMLQPLFAADLSDRRRARLGLDPEGGARS